MVKIRANKLGGGIGTEIASGAGFAVADLIWPPKGSRVGPGGLSLTFIFRNDTDEKVYFDKGNARIYQATWVDGYSPPEYVAPRDTALFMLERYGSLGINGSIWFRVGDNDPTQVNVDWDVDYTDKHLDKYQCYTKRDEKYQAGWDAWRDVNDIDLEIMLTYAMDRDQQVENVGITGSPSVANLDGKFYCFHRGINDGVFKLWYNIGQDKGEKSLSWQGDTKIDDSLCNWSPGAIALGDRVVVFYSYSTFAGGQLSYNVVSPNGSCSPRKSVDEAKPMVGAPSPVLYNDKILVFYTALGEQRPVLRYSTFTKDLKWEREDPIDGNWISQSPAAVVDKESIHVFYQGNNHDSTLWHTRSTDGRGWAKADLVEHVGMSNSPAAVFTNGKVLVFHQAWAERQQLWYIKYQAEGGTHDIRALNVGNSDTPSPVQLGDDKIYCFHNGLNGMHQLYYKPILIKDL